MRVTIAAVLVFILSTTFLPPELTKWNVKEGSYTINFEGGRIEGTLSGLQAVIIIDESDMTQSKITASVDVRTLKTGNKIKDKHAKADNALDANEFPTITFESIAITKTIISYEAKGNLLIKNTKREITIPFTFDNKGTEAILKGSFTIKPDDFDITRFGTPDEVRIDLSVPVYR